MTGGRPIVGIIAKLVKRLVRVADRDAAGAAARDAARAGAGDASRRVERDLAREAAQAAERAAYDYATTPAKLDHVFAAKHKFDPLVAQFGTREAVIQEFLHGVRGRTPASGTFAIPIVVGGRQVVVRGAVVDGVVKIGTAFTP